MKTVSMSGSPRENVGKKDARKSRREGKVPCVLYGGKEQIHFSLLEKDFVKIIFTPEVYILNIGVDGNQYTAILQDIQYHPVTDSILHADFLELIPGKPVIIGVPVKFLGEPKGVLTGGKLRTKIRKLIVKGMVDDLPDYFEISIADLDLNENIKVKDFSYPNLEFLDTPSAEIVGVKTARGAGMEEEIEEEVEAVEGEEVAEEGETPKEGEAPKDAKTERGTEGKG